MDELLTHLTSIWAHYWVMIVIGLGAGLIAFAVGRSLNVGSAKDKAAADKALDNFRVASPQERRAESRRPGNPVEVEVVDPNGSLGPMAGWVIDRSRGGLSLQVPVEIPPGTVLNAWPRHREIKYSVQIEVRSCRPANDGFMLGCQFLQLPPLNVLLMFG